MAIESTPDLVGWYRAFDLEGETVDAWPDASGQGNDLTAASPVRVHPHFLNGKHVILAEGTDFLSAVDAVQEASGYSLFVVWAQGGRETFHHTVLHLFNSSSRRSAFVVRRNASGNLFSYWDNGNDWEQSSYSAPVDGEFHIWEWHLEANDQIEFFLDGVSRGTAAIGSLPTGLSRQLQVDETAIGMLAEFVFVRRRVTAQERADIYDELTARYFGAGPGLPVPLVKANRLEQLISGLLARHEYDEAAYPFSLPDWTAPATTSLELNGGRLRCVRQTSAENLITYDRLGPIDDCYMQAVLLPSSGPTMGLGIGGRFTDTTTGSSDGIFHGFLARDFLTAIVSGIHVLVDNLDGPSSVFDARFYPLSISHRISFALEGQAAAACHFTSGAVYETDDVVVSPAAAPCGLHWDSNDAPTMDCERFFVTRGRYATVEHLDEGMVARVLRSDGVILVAAAAGVDGTARLDFLTVPLGSLTLLAIYAPDGRTLVDVARPPAGIWPGDVWAWRPARRRIQVAAFGPGEWLAAGAGLRARAGR